MKHSPLKNTPILRGGIFILPPNIAVSFKVFSLMVICMVEWSRLVIIVVLNGLLPSFTSIILGKVFRSPHFIKNVESNSVEIIEQDFMGKGRSVAVCSGITDWQAPNVRRLE